MNTESLYKIYQEITKDPIKGIFIIIFAFIVTIVSWYISSYIKEKAKIRATKHRDDKPPKEPQSDSKKSQEDKGRHFPIVSFSDGTNATVQVSITYRIFDSKKYTYESEDPLGILYNLSDARVRQLLEPFTLKDAKERRRETEIQLKRDLIDEFARYGIMLQSINIGAIQPAS